MNWKKFLIHALCSTIISCVAALIFNSFYHAWVADFSRIINSVSIFAVYLFMNLFYSFAYMIGEMWKGEKSHPWVNVVLAILTFASIFFMFLVRLPLDIPNPELFPGLAVPLLLFPLIGFYTLLPFFKGMK